MAALSQGSLGLDDLADELAAIGTCPLVGEPRLREFGLRRLQKGEYLPAPTEIGMAVKEHADLPDRPSKMLAAAPLLDHQPVVGLGLLGPAQRQQRVARLRSASVCGPMSSVRRLRSRLSSYRPARKYTQLAEHSTA